MIFLSYPAVDVFLLVVVYHDEDDGSLYVDLDADMDCSSQSPGCEKR